MYHVIAPPPAGAPFPGLYVQPQEFTAQMQALKAAGWHPVTLDQLRANWTKGARLPAGKPIVITFDNGYRSQYANALPVLRKLGWVADENMQLTGLPPSQGGLTTAEVRALVDAGWELDTQGISHADLVTLDASELPLPDRHGRRILQRRYDVPVNWFCYPSGHYDATVIDAVRAAGFVGSTTVVPGLGQPQQRPLPPPAAPGARRHQPSRAAGADRRGTGAPRRRAPTGDELTNGPPMNLRHWAAHLGAASLRDTRPLRRPAWPPLAVAIATIAIYPLEQVARVVSLSVVYLPAVLLISTYWGFWLGLLTSLLSAAAFNFFHLPPTGRFTIADSRNWVALAAFMVVAVVASTIAELARSRALEAERRRAEADLAAALARELLQGVDTATALASAARRVAEALGLPSAAIEAGPDARAPANGAGAARSGRPTGSDAAGAPADLPADTSSGCAVRWSRRSRRWSRSPSAATRCRPSSSKPARCAARMTSRRLCCAPSPTTCGRR